MNPDKKRVRFLRMLGILAVFLLIAAVLLVERMGIRPGGVERKNIYLDPELVLTAEDAIAPMEPTCLVITDLGREDAAAFYEQFSRVLLDMKVPHDVIDLGSQKIPASFSAYHTVVLMTPDMEAIGERLQDLCAWVKTGGYVYLAMVPGSGIYTDFLLRKAGVAESGDYTQVDTICFEENAVLGGGMSYPIPDGFDSSIAYRLRPEAQIFACDRPGGTPLIWSYDYGDGRFIVSNFAAYDLAYRGFFAVAYALMEDVSVYPVLNGGTIFLDDMPSPVPRGESEYITRDYHVSISEFYSTYWFRDIQQLSAKYDFPLVGLIIENYEQETDGTVTEQTDTARFSYFGNLILRSGGELGYHGYNHQPLCLDDVDYGDEFDYLPWESTNAMASAFNELARFCGQLYPTAEISVYVPPSNIMSQDGRAYISSLYPKVRVISGTYLPEEGTDLPYVQEFGIGEDGIIEFPRITSGTPPETVDDDYMRLVELFELNYHMVFSHFVHPDDALDVDRGAEYGWEALYANMCDLFDWLTASAPELRHLDASTMAGTIQRWSSLTVEKAWPDEDTMTIHLGNYIDEAYLMVRFNGTDAPDTVTGGTLTKMTDTLYLLDADQADITLEWNR